MSRSQCFWVLIFCFLTQSSYEYPYTPSVSSPASTLRSTNRTTPNHHSWGTALPAIRKSSTCEFPKPPQPPRVTPERFLRAGKGDPKVGWERYQATLKWRREERVDTILRESFPMFEVIKQYYPHFFHLRGRHNEPVFFERPAQTDIAKLREYGVGLAVLMRHYTMICEFQWQVVESNDMANSIYIVDLDGVRLQSFVGDTVTFVKRAASLSAQHYPERGGKIFLVNVPRWFKLIWRVVRPIIDDATMKKIFILRGRDEIQATLSQYIALENLPPEYGGTSMPLGQSPEEYRLYEWIRHNNELGARHCGQRDCPSCNWVPSRSY